MKLVDEDVPSSEERAVAPESASSAPRSRGSRPSASSRPPRVATATRVPAVSNTSTSNSDRITVTIDRCSAPATSSCNRTGAGEGGAATTPWNSAAPVTQPTAAMHNMPITRAPLTPRATSAAISTKPTSAAAGPKAVRSPKDTSVAG